MDPVTRSVREMYARFPYPSPHRDSRNLKELANLCTIFSLETGYEFGGKRVLDAGTGTGQRLAEVAAEHANAEFTAVDLSDASLSVARGIAAARGLKNVTFQQADLMDESQVLGSFDLILSMGVIHHLSRPEVGLRNVVSNLADDGLIFIYIYGEHGSRERMRRKNLVGLLMHDTPHDFDRGIRLSRELGFDSFEYGWDLDFADERAVNSVIVDAYLNVNENLFTTDTICELIRESGLHGFVVYGVTLDRRGCLFDTRVGVNGMVETTDVQSHLKTPALREAYQNLPLIDKYRFIDLAFEPNGYTLLGWKRGASPWIEQHPRLVANAINIPSAAFAGAGG